MKGSACNLQFLTVFLLLIAVGHAAIVYKDIYKDVMPFGLTAVSMFDEGTFNVNKKSFDLFKRYEGIEIGGVQVSTNRDENYKRQFHITLAQFFSTKNDAFYDALKTQERSKCENMKTAILGGGSAADKHSAVFANFFLDEDVADAIIELFQRKIIFTFEEMKRWEDSPRVDEFIGIDWLGFMATHQLIKNEAIKVEDIRAYIVGASRKKFIALVVAMRAIPDSDKDAWCSTFFTLFNGMKPTAFQDGILFTDKFDALTVKKNVSAKDYVDFAIATMNDTLKSVKETKITANLKKLDDDSSVGILTRCRMRNFLIAKRKYFGVEVAPEIVFAAFNFQPKTWANFADIQKTLNEIILLSRATQIERFESIMGFSEKPFSKFSANSAEELRKAFFDKKGYISGKDNIFVKMRDESKMSIFDTANDLRVGECLALKQFFKEADFFGFLMQYAFYKSPAFKLPAVLRLFTDEQQSDAYNSIDFSKLIAAFGTLKITSLNDLKTLFSNVIASNKKFPELDVLKALKYKSKEALIKIDMTAFLTDIYVFTVEYCRTNFSSFSALTVRAHSSKIELFLTFAAPFQTDSNIFHKKITEDELKAEQFNSINYLAVETSLKKINPDVVQAEEILIAFVAKETFAKFYGALVTAKKIPALSPVTVLSFIGYIDKIATAIALVGQQDVILIAKGPAPAYFNAFVTANFFNVAIPDAKQLKREVAFMIEMRDMLTHDISVLKDIASSVDLWSSLSVITRPESIYMKQADCQPIISVLQPAASNVGYMNVIRQLFKVFIPVLNKSLLNEGIKTEEQIKSFFIRNGGLHFDTWIEKLVTLNLFGIAPDADVDDSKLVLRRFSTDGDKTISQKVKDTENALNLNENAILEFIAKLTLSTSKFWYHFGLEIARPTRYTDAVADFTRHYLNLFNYLVIVAGGQKGTQAENEIQLIFSPAPALADTLFANNFFNLQQFSTKKSIPQEIVQANLGFVTSSIEMIFSAASVSVSEEKMLTASADTDFFEKSSNDALRTAWEEFSNIESITQRIKKLVQSSTSDSKSLLQLFIEEWKNSIASPEVEIKEKSSEILDDKSESLTKSDPEKEDTHSEKSLKSSNEENEESTDTVPGKVTDTTDNKSKTTTLKDPSSTKSAKVNTKLSSTIKFIITITVLTAALAFIVLAVYFFAWKRQQRLNGQVYV